MSLDGRVRPVRGALSIALQARENGITNLLIPEENATEAAVVEGVNVFPVRDLREAVEIAQDIQAGKESRIPPLKLNIAVMQESREQISRRFCRSSWTAECKTCARSRVRRRS